ncbi:hypothetical protein [Chitinophaga sp. sic0106]|uniref:LIC11966 family surface protein n=1 Tax=Chitinophaga sp. sic0106 TaxID=2854785 RepID=UPI001C47B1B7|nr:hypothetical protein [Chitinophaga sp. sic0106]MBV7532134.1 hypothetical protein [Chitinophaga sp. sic0106]
MKKVNSILPLFGAAFISMNIASCGTTADPVEYNNKLMTVMNENEKDMNAMNGAMSSQDYTKAETVRKSWSEHLDASIKTVDKMEAIDDAGLKAAVSEGLKNYKKLADEDYKTLIDLRTKEKTGDVTVQPQIQANLDKINHSFDAIGNKINQASDAFEKKATKQ